MAKPTLEIEGCAAAHMRLRSCTANLPDEIIRRPSLLPEWTVGHVLTHLARNAEAMCRRIDAAIHGEIIEQYAGGPDGRVAEIEEGAHRRAADVVNDAAHWAQQLDDRFGALPDESWERPVRTVRGDEHPVALLPFRRWREVEIHLVDLGIGFTPTDWSPDLVRLVLPRLLDQLPDRADERALMAWMTGRGPAPELTPWG